MKGGNKTIEIFYSVKKKGIPCTLTIIGSTPTQIPKVQILLFILISTNHHLKDKNFLNKYSANPIYLVAPTLFDCFGIIYCEASAYGIPVLTTDVGGISQAVHNGYNGFLFTADTPASEYADKIIDLYMNKDMYTNLRRECRKHFETSLELECLEKAA